jgi:hypothetical protein
MMRRSNQLLSQIALLSVACLFSLGCGSESTLNGGGSAGTGASSGGAGTSGGSGSAGASGDNGVTTNTSCNCDVDHPELCDMQTCTFWTCRTVPTEFGHKVHCDASNPGGGAHGPGAYMCPEFAVPGSRPDCPATGAPGMGEWNCLANSTMLSCDRGGAGGGSGGSGGSTTGGGTNGGGGWECTGTPEFGQTCTQDMPEFPGGGSWDCRDVVQPDGTVKSTCTGSGVPGGGGNGDNGFDCTTVGEFHVCTGGPDYPGGGGSGMWMCYYSGDNRVCTSPPGGGNGGSGGGAGSGGSAGGGMGNVCVPGQQRWCDGATYCSWGKQICDANGNGWGTCVEGNPNTGRTEGPDTACSCYYPFAFNQECCETPDCLVQGTRQLPCNTVNGGLCESCGDDSQCGSGICARALRYVPDQQRGPGTFPTLEQFCSKTCDSAGDCGAGYNCVRPNGSPVQICVPTDGSCFR